MSQSPDINPSGARKVLLEPIELTTIARICESEKIGHLAQGGEHSIDVEYIGRLNKIIEKIIGKK